MEGVDSTYSSTMYNDCFCIRTITCFVRLRGSDFIDNYNHGDDSNKTHTGNSASTLPVLSLSNVEDIIEGAALFLQDIRGQFQRAGYTVQTVRVATNPFGEWLLSDDDKNESSSTSIKLDVMELRLQKLHEVLIKWNIDFCSLGPATTILQVEQCIVPILLISEKFSVSASLPWNDITMAQQCATVIQQIATQTLDGIGNFRFCVTAAAVDYIPFFPAAKSSSSTTKIHSTGCTTPPLYQFAIGLENGVLLHRLLQQCGSICNIPTIFAAGYCKALIPVQQLCHEISIDNAAFEYIGIDTSLNPSIDTGGSIAAAIEVLDEVEYFGSPGTLAAASILTHTIQNLRGIKHCGYSGIMLPLCEDQRLAELTKPTPTTNCRLRISDLLSISQVCGVGIDTVPIPGDTSTKDLTSILLDVAGLAHRWNKSLSCRVFPVPGKKVGDRTSFDSPYMINANILSLTP